MDEVDNRILWDQKLVQQLTDCKFFLAGLCRKGADCQFRHCQSALYNKMNCKLWAQGHCTDFACRYRHPEYLIPRRTDVDRSMIKCHWFAQGSCKKGESCPFSHAVDQPTVVKDVGFKLPKVKTLAEINKEKEMAVKKRKRINRDSVNETEEESDKEKLEASKKIKLAGGSVESTEIDGEILPQYDELETYQDVEKKRTDDNSEGGDEEEPQELVLDSVEVPESSPAEMLAAKDDLSETKETKGDEVDIEKEMEEMEKLLEE